MPKVTAPLLSFDARGQIAKTQVYSSWKGVAYARRYAIPSNPNTAEQILTRSVFSWLQAFWKYAPSYVTAAFDAYASSLPMTGRNALAKFNIGALREAANLDDLVMSPGARSGLIAAGVTLTPGDGTITVELDAPQLPTGWSITAARAVAIPDQDPNTGTDFAVASGTDDTAPWSISLTSLTNDQLYQVGGWFEFLRPDGKTAYGPSLNDTTTPTAP